MKNTITKTQAMQALLSLIQTHGEDRDIWASQALTAVNGEQQGTLDFVHWRYTGVLRSQDVESLDVDDVLTLIKDLMYIDDRVFSLFKIKCVDYDVYTWVLEKSVEEEEEEEEEYYDPEDAFLTLFKD